MFSFAVSQGKAADLSELDLKVRSISVALRIRERRCRNRRQPPCLCRLVGRLLRLPRGPTWTTRSPGSPRGQRTPGTSGEKRSRRLPSMTPSLLFNHDITPPVMWWLGGGGGGRGLGAGQRLMLRCVITGAARNSRSSRAPWSRRGKGEFAQ